MDVATTILEKNRLEAEIKLPVQWEKPFPRIIFSWDLTACRGSSRTWTLHPIATSFKSHFTAYLQLVLHSLGALTPWLGKAPIKPGSKLALLHLGQKIRWPMTDNHTIPQFGSYAGRPGLKQPKSSHNILVYANVRP